MEFKDNLQSQKGIYVPSKGWFSLATESESELSRSRKSAYDLVKIEKRSRKRSRELDGIGVGRIRTFPFSSDSAYDFVAYDLVKTTLSESEAEAEDPTNCKVPKRTL